MTDFQRLRRNVLGEIHDHSAPHRMLFSYEKKELSAAEIWDSLLVPTQRKGGWAGPEVNPKSQPRSALFFHRRSEEHTSELQSRGHLVCRLLLEKKKK